jgi:hypothetical protein
VEQGDAPEVGVAEQPQAFVVREILERGIRHTGSLGGVRHARKGHKSHNPHDPVPRLPVPRLGVVRRSGK